MQLDNIRQNFKKDLRLVSSEEDLKRVRIEYLGRKGRLTEILRGLKNLSKRSRKEKGAQANALKEEIISALARKELSIKRRTESAIEDKEWIDVTAPGKKLPRGHLHPLSRIRRKIISIFESLGFSVVEGPEVETEYNNFDALNIPKHHPARDMMDTFWIATEENEPASVLRTHTSPVQIHFMKAHKPPFRIISLGRCFRYEATDASHDIQFHQVEGLMIGRDVSVANFKAVIRMYFQRLFSEDIEIRLKPSYFPFVEPGFEVDMTCLACSGKGCGICQKTGWLEMMGAGMVHPNVLKEVGYIPGQWQGFAFGGGYDRLAMMKYNIEDIRQMHSGDLRFFSRL